MFTCEICGRELGSRAYLIKVGRVEYLVCNGCARRHGKVIRVIELTRRRAGITPAKRYAPRVLSETEVVEDYAERIRRAREDLGYTRELLARLIGEKESTIRRIENGTLTPSLGLAKKLEKVLGIRLVEEVIEERMEGGKGRVELTLGDVVNFEEE